LGDRPADDGFLESFSGWVWRCNGFHQNPFLTLREEAQTMKVQIEKFSVHQNAKVFAVLMALSSLVMVIPFMLIVSMGTPEGAFPLFMLFVFPLMYLVLGYVMIAIGCWLYNWIAKRMGGLEFESRSIDMSA
jgi:hypothetical protein